jgi:hypothetical protein
MRRRVTGALKIGDTTAVLHNLFAERAPQHRGLARQRTQGLRVNDLTMIERSGDA